MKKNLLLIVAATIALLFAISSCRYFKKSAESAPVQQEEEEEALEPSVFDIYTNYGNIRIRLYDDTPLHRDNFIKLAEEKFYDGVLFHRIIKDFMIQTGDPFTKDTALVDRYGQGGPGYTLPAEILPEHTHKKGALAAARLGDYANPTRESSGSQFYIVLSEEGCRHLDGAYTVFGETIDGMNVVEKIGSLPTDAYNRPLGVPRIVMIKRVWNYVEPEEEESTEEQTTNN